MAVSAGSDHLANGSWLCLPPALHRHVSFNLKDAEGFSAGCLGRHFGFLNLYHTAAHIFSGDLTTPTATARSCSCKCRPLSRGVLTSPTSSTVSCFFVSLPFLFSLL